MIKQYQPTPMTYGVASSTHSHHPPIIKTVDDMLLSITRFEIGVHTSEYDYEYIELRKVDQPYLYFMTLNLSRDYSVSGIVLRSINGDRVEYNFTYKDINIIVDYLYEQYDDIFQTSDYGAVITKMKLAFYFKKDNK